MADEPLRTAVAFIIYNRPEKTAQVFARIASARPRRLLVIADGPNAHRAGDDERCAATRAIIEQVDWPCEVLTDFSATNLGCSRRVSTGLDWVFTHVAEAIILEDDCLPDPSFFRFCQELLARYHEDSRVMTISGDNFQFGRRRTSDSYYFSRYPHWWGWATWRRAWQHYDHDMRLWPRVRDEKWLADLLGDRKEAAYWRYIFQRTYEGRNDSWAYRWTLSCWLQHALAILPAVNLISNIGFGPGATHTIGKSPFANLPFQQVQFPLLHPPFMIRDAAADRRTARTMFKHPPLPERLIGTLKRRWRERRWR
jgi:hypothetical protein